ncbi:hypothetical protein L6R53_22700 [Myxococcota bacterium]|nr:hypothetical protein [Myxococcota bacterium]
MAETPSTKNPAIPRDLVHRLAEACSDEGAAFTPTALRLVKEQRRLSRYIEQNVQHLGPLPAQVALHMLTVTLRIFEQVGGRMGKVSTRDIDAAAARIQAVADQLLPADKGLSERAKAIAWRAQPHILDEVLWALYDRDEEEKKEGEADLGNDQSALVYLVLWLAVEALDANWRAPEKIEG